MAVKQALAKLAGIPTCAALLRGGLYLRPIVTPQLNPYSCLLTA
jgi:hypothetical protein